MILSELRPPFLFFFFSTLKDLEQIAKNPPQIHYHQGHSPDKHYFFLCMHEPYD